MKVATSVERLNELFNSDPNSDTAIAEKLNVSKQTVSSWRSGRRSPKKSVMVQISELYGVSLEWLMGYDVENEDPEISIVSGMMETMTKEQKQQVIDLVKILVKK